MDDPRTDEALLASADPEAFGVFYRRHLRSVLAFLLHRTGRADLAADLAAETFAGALQSRSRFVPSASASASAKGWLFSIAANKLADSARRGAVVDRSRRELGMPVRALDDPALERAEELIDAQRLAGDLDALLAELPEEQRVALLARVVGERDYHELAAEWNCSEAVVRQRVFAWALRLAPSSWSGRMTRAARSHASAGTRLAARSRATAEGGRRE